MQPNDVQSYWVREKHDKLLEPQIVTQFPRRRLAKTPLLTLNLNVDKHSFHRLIGFEPTNTSDALVTSFPKTLPAIGNTTALPHDRPKALMNSPSTQIRKRRAPQRQKPDSHQILPGRS